MYILLFVEWEVNVEEGNIDYSIDNIARLYEPVQHKKYDKLPFCCFIACCSEWENAVTQTVHYLTHIKGCV